MDQQANQLAMILALAWLNLQYKQTMHIISLGNVPHHKPCTHLAEPVNAGAHPAMISKIG